MVIFFFAAYVEPEDNIVEPMKLGNIYALRLIVSGKSLVSKKSLSSKSVVTGEIGVIYLGPGND